MSGIKHHNPVRHGHRFRLIVRHVDGGAPHPLVDLTNFATHFMAQFGVQVGERFIKQKSLRVTHQSAPHRHPLTLAAGKIPRVAIEQMRQAEDFRCLFHARHPFRF